MTFSIVEDVYNTEHFPHVGHPHEFYAVARFVCSSSFGFIIILAIPYGYLACI
jgi:hypothetical protein